MSARDFADYANAFVFICMGIAVLAWCVVGAILVLRKDE